MSNRVKHYVKGDKVWTWRCDKKGYEIFQVTILHPVFNPYKSWESYFYRYKGKTSSQPTSLLFRTRAKAVQALRTHIIQCIDGLHKDIRQKAESIVRCEHDLRYYLDALSELQVSVTKRNTSKEQP